MAKKRIDQTKTKTESGTKDRKAKVGSARKPSRKVIKKAWHITDFQDLFELSEDIRKGRSGPLRYTKSIVTLSPFATDAESRHCERMRLLKSRPERHLLRSVLQDLTDWAATKPFALRGFLVTAAGKPATPEYLAAQLNLVIEDIKQALAILEQLGFLERIPMTDQPESKKTKRKPARKSGKTGGAKKTKKTTQKTRRKNEQKSQNAAKDTVDCHKKRLPDSAGLKRPDPARSGKPLKKDKAKVKDKYKGKVNQKATHGRMAVEEKENNNGYADHKVSAPGRGKADGEPPSAPTAAPEPLEPHESDDPGETNVIPFTPPRTSLTAASGRQRRYMGTHGRSYDRTDEVFGLRVYVALGFRGDSGSIAARREICSFASKWCEARAMLARLPPEVVDDLGMRLIAEAKKIAKRGSRNRKRGAVWCGVADKLMAARLKEAM